MLDLTDLTPIVAPIAWRGDELTDRRDWIYVLSADEIAELETVGRRFLDDDSSERCLIDFDIGISFPAGQWLSARSPDCRRGTLSEPS